MCAMRNFAMNILVEELMYNMLKALFAAGIVTLICVNATGADMSAPADTPATTGAAVDRKISFQEHIERMRTMTPDQRAWERELMRQEMQSLSPEQRAEQRKDMRAQFEKMSPEDRSIAREQFRQEWNNLTPEQRAERRKEMHEYWKNMPPEEREQIRNKMKDHWKNMSPEQRQQFKRDLDEQYGIPPSAGDKRGGESGGAGKTPAPQ
jgi:mRNA-degrading endonuclease RelE of RelBE toxin-antitoxin system